MSAEEEADAIPQHSEDAAACSSAAEEEEDTDEPCATEEAYEHFKIISKKALADYKRAEELFLDFLATADVWSSKEVSSTIIDFHLVEKCRTKFRAFVRAHGATVKFDIVESAPPKQEYHGTVTVTRTCKQQFLSKHPENVRPGDSAPTLKEREAALDSKPLLQCAAPTPITTGGVHIPYTPDDLFDTPGTFGRLPSGLRQYLSPQYRHPVFPSARDTTTGVVPFRHVKPEPGTAQQPAQDTDHSFNSALARNTPGAGLSETEANLDLTAWMDPLGQKHNQDGSIDVSDRQLSRMPTVPSQDAPHFPSQALAHKRFSLQDDRTGFPAGGPTLLPDAGSLHGRCNDTSISLAGDRWPLDAAQRRASCGLLSNSYVDGLPGQQALARRRTSAPSNARRSDVFTGMSNELALAAHRFLNSSSDYPEGAGVDQYDWLAPHMSAPAPIAVGTQRSRLTDASPRKSPRISYHIASMQPPQQHGSSDVFATGMQPTPTRQPRRQNVAQMLFHETSIKCEDVLAPRGIHANVLSVTPLSVTPLSVPLPDMQSGSAPLPLPHHSHASAPLPHQIRTHAVALLEDQQPNTDKDLYMEGLHQLLALEAAPQHHPQNPPSGTPNMVGHHHLQHLASSANDLSATPRGTPQHPSAAGHAHMHHTGSNIGEAYAAVDGLCSASFSIRSSSSAAVSLPDMLAVLASPDHCTSTCPIPRVAASETGCGPPNPTCLDALQDPVSPLPLRLNSGTLDGLSGDGVKDFSAALKNCGATHDIFADLPAGMVPRRQSSNAALQTPTDELYHESGLQRLVVRASDTSTASTEMLATPCDFPMEPDAWACDGFRLHESMYRARRTSL